MAKFAKSLGVFLVVAAFATHAEDTQATKSKIKTVETEGVERITQGQKAQQQIDVLARDTRSKVDEYQSHLKLVEGLKRYNAMLGKQLENQQEEIATLNQSIGEVALVERQILPLMAQMIDGLEAFIALDVPFLRQERQQRVDNLRDLLSRADVTVAEKTRRVLEAYQIENDYGRTIEAYKSKLDLGNASFDADFLRIGRVALMYRTVGNEDVGFWDAKQKRWQSLESVPYRRYIEQGLKIARQEIAPKLIPIPVNPAEEIKR